MSGGRWWVEAQGRAWGPYAEARLPAFAAEGRLGPDSRVARDAGGPFARAADTAELAGLFAPARPASAPAGAPAAPEPEPEPAAAPSDGSRPLLVISDAPETALATLETALDALGGVVRVRPGLWLLRAADGAAAVRNALSRGLGGGAMLLVVEAPLAAAAWFALEGDTDRALRRLWTG